MSFTPYDRPVRAAFIGLGRIYDLNVRAYLDNPDVEVVALVDPSEERRAERAADWPGAQTFASAAELAASGLEVDYRASACFAACITVFFIRSSPAQYKLIS